MKHGQRDSWRTHQGKPGVFDVCQDVSCPKDHFISTFKGSSPVEHEWHGIKHKGSR